MRTRPIKNCKQVGLTKPFCPVPSCFYCEHAYIWPGYGGSFDEPPEPPGADCKNLDVPEELLELCDSDTDYEERAARNCGHFSPQFINQKCPGCGKMVTGPRWKHRWFDGIWGSPCCSKDCVEIAEKDIIGVD